MEDKAVTEAMVEGGGEEGRELVGEVMDATAKANDAGGWQGWNGRR